MDATSALLSVTTGATQGSNNTSCVEATDLLLRVTRNPDSRSVDTTTVPLQLRVTEVPPITNLNGLPVPPPFNSDIKAHILSAGEQIEPGDSVAGATSIKSGTTYEVNALPGELHTYKVPVGWGRP